MSSHHNMSGDREILESTNERLIIKANLQNYTFPKETYKHDYIGHLIRVDEYNNIIDQASKVLSQAWMKKRDNDKINLPTFVIVLSVISVILTIAYMITIYYSTVVEDGLVLLVLSLVFVIIATSIAFGLSIYNFCRKMGEFKTVQKIIEEDLAVLFAEKNSIYNDKLHFRYDSASHYLEIRILRPNASAGKIISEEGYNNQDDERQRMSNNRDNNLKDIPKQSLNKNSKPNSRQVSKNNEVEMEQMR